MTGTQAYQHIGEKLASIYDKSEAFYISSLLLEWATGADRNNIIESAAVQLTADQQENLSIASERLLLHEPFQYVTGEAWFYQLRFLVTPAVLIPRPETEELVEEILKDIKTRSSVSLIDIGTGSGCIPVTIKKRLPQTEVSAIDVSENALDIARKNADLHDTGIRFFQTDFLDEKKWPSFSSFDIIVSNPPYIPFEEKKSMNENVTDFEPELALFVPDNDPFIFYKKIADFASAHLKENGKVFLETHLSYAHEVAEIFTHRGFQANVKKDISGNDRMVFATRFR